MKRLVSLFSIGFLSILTACGGSGSNNNGNFRNNNRRSADVRLIHAAPQIGPVDFLIDGDLFEASVPYLGTTEFRSTTSGSRSLRISEASSFAALVDESLGIVGDQDYNIVLISRVRRGSALLGATALVLTNSKLDPDEGRVRIRLIHGAPTLNSIDIYALPAGGSRPTILPAGRSATFGEVSRYLDSDAGFYTFEVTNAGQTGTALASSGPVELVEGNTYTVVLAEREAGGAPYSFIVAEDRGQ